MRTETFTDRVLTVSFGSSNQVQVKVLLCNDSQRKRVGAAVLIGSRYLCLYLFS